MICIPKRWSFFTLDASDALFPANFWVKPKLCSRKCARCVDARCEGVHSQNVGAPGGCVEALDVSPCRR
ncbi:hypothetical protein [Nitratifractor sp.]